MAKLPQRFRILVLRMTFRPILRSFFQRRGKRKSPRLGGEGLGEDGQKTIFDVGFNARPHLYPLPLERSSPLHDSGFTDDLPNNPALDFYKDAGNEKALASEERVWVRTVV